MSRKRSAADALGPALGAAGSGGGAPLAAAVSLEPAVLAAVARAVGELADPSSRAVRRRAETILGRASGSLDGEKGEIKRAAVIEISRQKEARAPGRSSAAATAAAAVSARPPSVATKKGKFSKTESADVCEAAEREAAALSMSVADLIAGKWKTKVERGANVWDDIASRFPSRPANSIYGHVKRRLHPGVELKKVRWTAADSARLKVCFDDAPSDWKAIALEFGRTPGACRDRYRTLYGEPSTVRGKKREPSSRGSDDGAPQPTSADGAGADASAAPPPAASLGAAPAPDPPRPLATAAFGHDAEWSAVEMARLRSVVVAGLPVLDVTDPTAVSFSALAAAVGTRSRLQCRKKWTELRNMSAGEKPRLYARLLKTPAEQLELCEQLGVLGATDESDVTWSKLGWDWEGCATTVALVRWRRLRAKYEDLDFSAALARVTEDLRGEVHSQMEAEVAGAGDASDSSDGEGGDAC